MSTRVRARLRVICLHGKTFATNARITEYAIRTQLTLGYRSKVFAKSSADKTMKSPALICMFPPKREFTFMKPCIQASVHTHMSVTLTESERLKILKPHAVEHGLFFERERIQIH